MALRAYRECCRRLAVSALQHYKLQFSHACTSSLDRGNTHFSLQRTQLDRNVRAAIKHYQQHSWWLEGITRSSSLDLSQSSATITDHIGSPPPYTAPRHYATPRDPKPPCEDVPYDILPEYECSLTIKSVLMMKPEKVSTGHASSSKTMENGGGRNPRHHVDN